MPGSTSTKAPKGARRTTLPVTTAPASSRVATSCHGSPSACLRESEMRFRGLFEDSPISLWEEDLSELKNYLDSLKKQGIVDFRAYFADHPDEVARCGKLIKVLDTNKCSIPLFHAKDKEDLIKNMAKVFGGMTYPEFTSELIAIAEGKKDFSWEGINYTLDGKPLILSLQFSVAPSFEKSFARVFISAVDVSEHRKAESALRESEERFRRVYEECPIGIILTDTNSQIAAVNPRFASIIGYSQHELVGRSFREFTYTDDLPENEQLLDRLLKVEFPFFTMQKRYIHKNGSLVWSNITVSAIRASDGKLYSLLTMVEDITEKKSAAEALQQEQYLYQTLMDNIPDSVFYKDLNHQFIRVNQATLKKFDLSSMEEIIGKSDADYFPDEITRENFAEENEIVKTGIPLINQEAIEIWPDRHSTTWASVTKMPLHDKSGQVIGTFGVARDITDRKVKEEEIKRLNADLEKKVELRTKELNLRNKELEAFNYSISHDLKAPLRGINGYSQLLIQEHSAQLDEEGRSFLKKLIFSSDQLNQLIDDLLSYSNLERRPIIRSEFMISEILKIVIDERKTEIKNRHILIHQIVKDEKINSSPEVITQIIRGYLDNAIKFTSQKSNPEIWITYDHDSDSSLLIVRDNGIGFDPKYNAKIFEVFFRLNQIDQYPGTGIGLAMVKKAADLLGCRVWAIGEPNVGSSFYLEFSKNTLW